MEPKRTLHSGNLVRRRQEAFYSLKRWWMGGRKMNQEIFDLKSLTKEEVAWLEEHFIDFAREQYLVRYERGS